MAAMDCLRAPTRARSRTCRGTASDCSATSWLTPFPDAARAQLAEGTSMSRVPIARLAVAALLLPSLPVLAAPIEIDLSAALARARRWSVAAIAAGGELAAAQ